MVGERRVDRRGRPRLAAALVGAGAVVGGILVPLSAVATTPAGASGVPTQVSASGTNPLAPVLSDVEGQLAFVVDAVQNLGPFLQCLESYTGTPEPGCYEGPP